jgi:restriction system protein
MVVLGSLSAGCLPEGSKHRDPVGSPDGSYVIDTTIRFRALGGAEFLVLIEAKLQGRPVERSVVQTLFQKVQSTGAHKGIVVSSAGFQRGAGTFARAHGIGLVQLTDDGMMYLAFSRDYQPQRSEKVAALHITETAGGYSMALLESGSEALRELLQSKSQT